MEGGVVNDLIEADTGEGEAGPWAIEALQAADPEPLNRFLVWQGFLPEGAQPVKLWPTQGVIKKVEHSSLYQIGDHKRLQN